MSTLHNNIIMDLPKLIMTNLILRTHVYTYRKRF